MVWMGNKGLYCALDYFLVSNNNRCKDQLELEHEYYNFRGILILLSY